MIDAIYGCVEARFNNYGGTGFWWEIDCAGFEELAAGLPGKLHGKSRARAGVRVPAWA